MVEYLYAGIVTGGHRGWAIKTGLRMRLDILQHQGFVYVRFLEGKKELNYLTIYLPGEDCLAMQTY
jgi:hypothetical protein